MARVKYSTVSCQKIHRSSSEVKSEIGSALVESAIAIPFLAFVLFAFIQWAMIVAAHMSVHNSAEVAARFAVLGGATYNQNEIQQIARNALPTVLDEQKLVVDAYTETHNVGGANGKKVDVSYNLPIMLAFVVPGSSGGQFTVKASAIMY